MLALARTSAVLVLLAFQPEMAAWGQSPCAPSSTNGLRPFGPGTEIRFEPSAAVFLPGECAVLVFSDKSESLETFYFSLATGSLGVGELHRSSDAPGVVQLEAATRTSDGESVLVVTSGTFKGASFIDQSREDRALVLGRQSGGGWAVERDLTGEWRRYLDGLRRETGGWLKVEALQSLGDRYLVGIRQFGDAYDRFDYGVRIVVWDPDEPAVTTVLADPRSLTFEEQGDLSGSDRIYMRSYGISSLECADAAAPGRLRCYLLASSEAGPGVHDVKTRLMAFDLEELSGVTSLPGDEVACFWGKGEGLTLLDESRALVIFDSDRDRKGGGAGGTDLFPLADHQDYYWIGSVARAEGSEADPAVGCVGP